MTDDIEAFDTGLSIRHPDGRFQQVKTPAGFTTLMFKMAVSAFDTAFRQLGHNPTVDEVYRVWPKVSKKSYSALFLTPEFRTALEYRGVLWEVDSGLSIEQQHTLLKLSDPFDKRSLPVKLRELGVPMPRFQNWLKQPLFWATYNKASIDNYHDALPAIRNRVIGLAEGGERWATELIYAKTGEWNPQQQQLEDARALILKIVEAVNKHVPDPKVRGQIMADVALHGVTLPTVSAQPSELES